ncbi:DUF4198 domain-containing protein [Desulfovibrionales bacterium]
MRFHTRLCTALALVCLLLSSTAAMSHEFILKPDTATPAAGEKTRVQAQAAHVFMVSEEAEKPETVKLYLLQNDKSANIALVEDPSLAALVGDFTLPQDGPAMLVGHRLPQIWCETTQGTLEGTRAELEAKGMKVKSAGKYEKFAKTMLNPASNDTLYTKTLGQELEIVLLTNPADLKPGSSVDVQVLLRGKPVSDATVGLTYDAFSTEQDTYKSTAQTDAQGKASLTVDTSALWMLRSTVIEKTPGSDADEHHLRATYVFPVK